MTSHDVPLSDVAQGEVFTKHVAQPDSAYAEAAGLNWLGAASPQVVKVVAVSDHTISTTKITPKRPTRAAAEAAGVELARIHLAGAPAFGSPPLGWPGPNFIGTQIQACEPDPDWARFYTTQRVLPFYRKAMDAGNIHDPERTVERACELIGAATWESAHVAPGVAGRIHGDLWSGNLLYGRPVSKNVLTETVLDDAGADNGEVDGSGVEPFFTTRQRTADTPKPTWPCSPSSEPHSSKTYSKATSRYGPWPMTGGTSSPSTSCTHSPCTPSPTAPATATSCCGAPPTWCSSWASLAASYRDCRHHVSCGITGKCRLW